MQYINEILYQSEVSTSYIAFTGNFSWNFYPSSNGSTDQLLVTDEAGTISFVDAYKTTYLKDVKSSETAGRGFAASAWQREH